MRTRLNPVEREARRRARSRASFSDGAYRHYDIATEGLGSSTEWEAAAEALASGRGTYRRVEGRLSDAVQSRDMAALGLTKMPDLIGGLKSAFRKAAFASHPDHAGTAEAFSKVMAAYTRLVENY